MSKTLTVSVIVPVYNEQNTNLKILTDVKKSLEKLTAKKSTITAWEVIVVNDGSEDATGEKLKKKPSQKIKVYTLERNRGNFI